MDELRIPEGINEEKLRQAEERLRPENKVSVMWRFSFGAKGIKKISIFGWLKKVREIWNNER